MIIHDVHIHTDTILMKCLNHLFHFIDAHFPVIRICAVRPFWHIVVLRVISPVKLRCIQLCLIDCRIIITGQNLHMCDTQILDVVYSCRKTVWVCRACLCKSKKLTRIADTRRRIGREVAHMNLIDHGVRRILKSWSYIFLKSFWIGRAQINHHASVTIDTRRSRIEVHGLVCLISNLDRVCIVYAV